MSIVYFLHTLAGYPNTLLFELLDYASNFDATIAVIIGAIVAVKSFRFQSIHTKRLQVIEEAYEKVKSASMDFQSLANPYQGSGELTKKQKQEKFENSVNKMLYFLNTKRIFFGKSEREKIDLITKKFFDAWTSYQHRESIAQDPVSTPAGQRTEVWITTWELINAEIPKLTEQLENEFQNILGIK